ncbi:MAG: AAA family ATPase [Candidatus Omnitrophica bacterium]|nr:AAA family ATPase [Candidatus Omnitrophota bacterium]MBU4479690.1 AAA family ATPase [Candidatus Omnitrophota bacterium]
MGKIIGVCNQKGGVGKTTTTINIGAFLAQSGSRVLIVDADPQANATSGLGIDKKTVQRGAYEALMGIAALEEIVLSGPVQNLFVAPSSVSLTGAEIELVDTPQREFRMKAMFGATKEQYDFIFIDCPPSLGLLTLNVLVAADSVIIPLQCEYYALEGLSQLMDTISLVKKSLNPLLAIEGVVLTMADYRTRLTGEVIKEVQEYFKDKVFESIIPRNIRLSEAPGFGQPILLYDPFSIGALKYESLAKELIARQPHNAQSQSSALFPEQAAAVEQDSGVQGAGNTAG